MTNKLLSKQERKKRQMTFGNKREKERKKRKRKMAIIAASILMCLGLITGVVNMLVSKHTMAQEPTTASKQANDSAANEILKNKKAVKVKDDTDKEIKRAKDAVSRANAAKLKKDIDDGKLITNIKNRQMIDDAVKKQADKDKDQRDKLQDQLNDAQKRIKDLESSQADSQKSSSDKDSQINDKNKQIDELKKQIDDLKQKNDDLTKANQKNKSKRW